MVFSADPDCEDCEANYGGAATGSQPWRMSTALNTRPGPIAHEFELNIDVFVDMLVLFGGDIVECSTAEDAIIDGVALGYPLL